MTTANDLLAAARRELTYTESPPNSNRTKFAAEAGHANGQPWCATFVVAMARRVGLTLPSESAYTPTMAQGFKNAGRWHLTPQAGDIAFFDFPDSKHRIQHVGIVVGAAGSYVTCIEGNTSPGDSGSQDNGGGVYTRRRPKAHAVGYGRPAYSDGRLPVRVEADRNGFTVVNDDGSRTGVFYTSDIARIEVDRNGFTIVRTNGAREGHPFKAA